MADEKITEIEELFPLEEIRSHSKKELQYRSYMLFRSMHGIAAGRILRK